MLLVGRQIARSAKNATVSPPLGSLTMAGLAPTVSVSFSTLFKNNFNGLDGGSVDVDDVVGITWAHSGSGGAELDTAIVKFGTAAARLHDVGSGGSNLYTNIVPGFTSTADWTLAGWIYLKDNVQGITFFEANGGTPTGTNFQGYIRQGTPGTFLIQSTSPGAPPNVANNTWYHFAIVNNTSTGNIDLFFNGDRIVQDSGGSGAFDDFAFRSISIAGDDVNLDSLYLVDTVLYSGLTYTVPTTAY